MDDFNCLKRAIQQVEELEDLILYPGEMLWENFLVNDTIPFEQSQRLFNFLKKANPIWYKNNNKAVGDNWFLTKSAMVSLLKNTLGYYESVVEPF